MVQFMRMFLENRQRMERMFEEIQHQIDEEPGRHVEALEELDVIILELSYLYLSSFQSFEQTYVAVIRTIT